MPVAVGGGTGMQAENSDVFPEGSVAVATRNGPVAPLATVATKVASPAGSVATSVAPRGRCPGP